MKIDEIYLSPWISPKAADPSKEGKNFAEILKEAVYRVPGLSRPVPVVTDAWGGAAKTAQEMVELVLSRLELFREALSRPGLSLKCLSPLAEALEHDSTQLSSLVQDLPADSPLRRLVEEVAALSWVESWKFRRGDYL